MANFQSSCAFCRGTFVACKYQQIVFLLFQVLLQTYIEYLRGKVEDSQTINHHGKSLQVEDGKVVTVSEVGEGQAVGITPLETDHG